MACHDKAISSVIPLSTNNRNLLLVKVWKGAAEDFSGSLSSILHQDDAGNSDSPDGLPVQFLHLFSGRYLHRLFLPESHEPRHKAFRPRE